MLKKSNSKSNWDPKLKLKKNYLYTNKNINKIFFYINKLGYDLVFYLLCLLLLFHHTNPRNWNLRTLSSTVTSLFWKTVWSIWSSVPCLTIYILLSKEHFLKKFDMNRIWIIFARWIFQCIRQQRYLFPELPHLIIRQ